MLFLSFFVPLFTNLGILKCANFPLQKARTYSGIFMLHLPQCHLTLSIGMQCNAMSTNGPHPLLFWRHLLSASPTPQAPRPICAMQRGIVMSAFLKVSGHQSEFKKIFLMNLATFCLTPLSPVLLRYPGGHARILQSPYTPRMKEYVNNADI